MFLFSFSLIQLEVEKLTTKTISWYIKLIWNMKFLSNLLMMVLKYRGADPPTVSHSAANHPSASYRSLFAEAKRTMSSTKSSYENHSAPLESEVKLAAPLPSPAPWSRPFPGGWVWSPGSWNITPICQSKGTVHDVHAMLQRHFNHDGPTTSRALRSSTTHGALPRLSCL